MTFFLFILVAAFVADYFLKRRFAGWMTFFRVVSTICILAALGFWFYTEADSNYQAAQCERRVERRFKPQALQSWATNLMALPNGFSNGPVCIYRHSDRETNAPIYTNLPPGLYGIWNHQNRPYVSIREARAGKEGYVYLFWGSGILGHWGMSIGSPTFVPARTSDKMRLWEPGVYFWRDCQ